MRLSPPTRAIPRPADAAALALAPAAALGGCAGGSSAGSGAGAPTAAEASAPGATAPDGFDGGLLPASMQPHGFTLTDQYGRRVSLSSFRGRVVILAFLYSTSRATAPLIAQQIRGALDELEPAARAARGVRAIAVSVDPAADTPAHVRAFLRATSLTGRLEYLTGSSAQRRRARGLLARRPRPRSARARRAPTGGRVGGPPS